mmetsp:Transcript_37522/g.81756  ORF Transcript_37522/g.81756 Transcript_37522/m.81756 type:complete len:139 (-) Transcript_37522:45-461(-)
MSKMMGPREKRRSQQYMQQAEASLREEKKHKEDSEKREIEAARFAANGRGVAAKTASSSSSSCFDVGTDFGKDNDESSGLVKDEALCDGPAITYWTSRLQPDDKRRHRFPAKSCAFTNDIRDGRLNHDDGMDCYPRKE